MSIERERYGAPIVFRCDGKHCHEFEETHCEEFSGALAKVKSHGWAVLKFGGEWLHLCPDCQVQS